MRSYTVIFLMSLTFWGLIGCTSSYGVNFVTNNVAVLTIGKTTIKEATEYFGDPLLKESVSRDSTESIVLTYRYDEKNHAFFERINKKRLELEFVDSVLNAFVYSNSFDEDSTDFDSNISSKLAINKTTKEDVFRLMGRRGGDIRLPSELVKSNLSESIIKDMPTTAKELLLYQYYYSKKVKFGEVYALRYKSLLLFFDSNATLIKTYKESNTD